MAQLGSSKIGVGLIGAESTTVQTVPQLASGNVPVAESRKINIPRLGTSELGSELLASESVIGNTKSSVSISSSGIIPAIREINPTVNAPVVVSTPGVLDHISATKTNTTELGTNQIGRSVLAGVVGYGTAIPSQAQSFVSELDSTVGVDTTVNPYRTNIEIGLLGPVSLSPTNIEVFYNEFDNEFQTNWFTKQTPLDNPGEIVIVGKFRDKTFDPIEIVVEHKTSGKQDSDILHPKSHILRLGKDIAEQGGEYRLRFPGYSQTDALDRIHFALGWNNEAEFSQNWEIDPVNVKHEPQRALAAVLLSENSRLDATLDEIFESQHITTANDVSLEYLANEVGTNRINEETDKSLRKRVLAKSATRTFSSVGSDVTDLIKLLFDDSANEVTLQTVNNEPVLKILVPKSVIDNHVLTTSEIESVMDESVSSSYNAVVEIV